jgi:hypothetical protein
VHLGMWTSVSALVGVSAWVQWAWASRCAYECFECLWNVWVPELAHDATMLSSYPRGRKPLVPYSVRPTTDHLQPLGLVRKRVSVTVMASSCALGLSL